MSDPYRTAPVTVDRALLEGLLEVLTDKVGAVSSGWWPRVYDLRDQLSDALGEPRVARPQGKINPVMMPTPGPGAARRG